MLISGDWMVGGYTLVVHVVYGALVPGVAPPGLARRRRQKK